MPSSTPSSSRSLVYRCDSCDEPSTHVQLAGGCLAGKSQRQVKGDLIKCGVVKPIHVIKVRHETWAILHFKNINDTNTFWDVYHERHHPLCPVRFPDIQVNAAFLPRTNPNSPRQLVTYGRNTQPMLSLVPRGKILCSCRRVVVNNNIDDNPPAAPPTPPSTTTNDTTTTTIHTPNNNDCILQIFHSIEETLLRVEEELQRLRQRMNDVEASLRQ
ncbi:predicted protein [Lichtheimia corymbifera JMRC:FSU:9682]|uniref:Uncharacterized protein n=1 Tax=Lichtheimia corymbifera JMRC:FSU:9682 TaxID=1263082 RepID=A0A068SGD9_9FUNG|nr:predicted protein [Lichtheimia corymbifera JMRC:FSU:9682]